MNFINLELAEKVNPFWSGESYADMIEKDQVEEDEESEEILDEDFSGASDELGYANER